MVLETRADGRMAQVETLVVEEGAVEALLSRRRHHRLL
jgi:hypothetical protein